MLKAMLGEAWRAMGANRLRTALTMLGMVIGVGAVVIMMAIGQGAQYAVQQTISTMGSNLFIVLSGSFTTSGVRSGAAGAPTLNVADGEAVAALPGRLGWEIRLTVQGGLRILERLRRVRGDVFARRPTLGKADWLVLAGRSLTM